MSNTWYSFAQADKVFTPFKVTVSLNKHAGAADIMTLEMLEAEVCCPDEPGLDAIKDKWYGTANRYRWKGLFNDKEITYTFNSETGGSTYWIDDTLPSPAFMSWKPGDTFTAFQLMKEYLQLACYRNGIGIPGNLPMVEDENIAKMKSVMNDYSYEEYFNSSHEPQGYNPNTFDPKNEEERKLIRNTGFDHVKITHGINYKQLYKDQLVKMEKDYELSGHRYQV